MKKLPQFLFLLLGVTIGTASVAQMPVDLKLHHEWDGQALVYGQNYMDAGGRTVTISRVNYYMSEVTLNHDGGQSQVLPATWVLGKGNVTNYSLGTATLNELESVDFGVGVEQATNHLDPALYSAGHPLAQQSPSMHWGWTSGYFFLCIDGMVDVSGDGFVDTSFEIYCIGDNLYTNTSVASTGTANGALEIHMSVDVSGWLRDINLTTAGAAHGSDPINATCMANTNTYSVFGPMTWTDLINETVVESHVSFDYSRTYAPTINYTLGAGSKTSIRILDIQGREVFAKAGLAHEGTFFVEKELPTGIYVVNFIQSGEVVTSDKMIVRR